MSPVSTKVDKKKEFKTNKYCSLVAIFKMLNDKSCTNARTLKKKLFKF